MLSFRRQSTAKPKPEYTKWYERDYLLAVFTMVSCTVISAFLIQEWLKNFLSIAGMSGVFWLFAIFFTRKLYHRDRINPKWLNSLQNGIRITLTVILVISFIALILTDQEHIRDVLYH